MPVGQPGTGCTTPPHHNGGRFGVNVMQMRRAVCGPRLAPTGGNHRQATGSSHTWGQGVLARRTPPHRARSSRHPGIFGTVCGGGRRRGGSTCTRPLPIPECASCTPGVRGMMLVLHARVPVTCRLTPPRAARAAPQHQDAASCAAARRRSDPVLCTVHVNSNHRGDCARVLSNALSGAAPSACSTPAGSTAVGGSYDLGLPTRTPWHFTRALDFAGTQYTIMIC